MVEFSRGSSTCTLTNVVTDLVAIGVGDHEAKALIKSMGHVAGASLAASGTGKAARL